MRLMSALSRLLMSLAVFGLVIGAAMPAASAATGGSAAMMSMAEGMPPCEDMGSDIGGVTKQCPFQTVCAVKCPQATLAAASILLPVVSRTAGMPGDLPGRISLAQAPPARPPKA